MNFLLIAASFFGYSEEIKLGLERHGRKVLLFEDRPKTSTSTKALLRLFPSVVRQASNEYFEQVIAEAARHDIRDVLVIKGEALEPDAIRKMRRALPKARFTLYFWDSYRNMPPSSAEKVDLFDHRYSFDPADVASDPRLTYRPLFYLDDYRHLPKSQIDIDALFVGTVHTDRYEILSKVAQILPRHYNFQRLMYLPSSALFALKQLSLPSYWKAERNDFIFKPLKKSDVLDLIARSRIVIDIERSVQVGFTMRTIETLGASKKLITTNPHVESADFFDRQNQCVIDRQRPVIPSAFLETPWAPLNEELLHRYSLNGWLSTVVGLGR